MSASQYCKSQGLKSLVELSGISNVPTRTLFRMYIDNNKHFKCLVAGAVAIKNKVGGNA